MGSLVQEAQALSRGKHAPSTIIKLQHLPPIHQHGISPAAVHEHENRDVELSDGPLNEEQNTAVGVVPSVWDPYMNRFRFLATCVSTIADALSDGAAGALIPYIEKHYNITYTLVSLIFVGQAIGFLFAAAFLDALLARLGRARFLGLSQTVFLLAFLPAIGLAPFGVVVTGFVFVGFSYGLNVSITNTFNSGLQNGTFILGLVYACYGVGGITAPLIATTIVTVTGTVWSRYYLIVVGVAFISLILSVWSFWGYEKEHHHLSRTTLASDKRSAMHKMISTLRMRIVILGSIFIFSYQGAEISISGWVISFLINARGGDPSSVAEIPRPWDMSQLVFGRVLLLVDSCFLTLRCMLARRTSSIGLLLAQQYLNCLCG